MSRNAIVLVANYEYLDHARSLFGHLRHTGRWDGDLVLLGNCRSDLMCEFVDIGVRCMWVYGQTAYAAKYELFTPDLTEQYDRIMYLDCDMIVGGDVRPVFYQDGSFLADYEPFKVKDYFDAKSEKHKELSKAYDLDRSGFNSACMLFDTCVLNREKRFPETYMLTHLDLEYGKINLQNGGDQPILNLVFMDVCRQIEGVCFVGDRRRRASCKLQHTTRWLAPWVKHIEYYNKGLELFREMKK